MIGLRLRTRLMIGTIIMGLFAFFVGCCFRPAGFSSRWNNVRDGMTQDQVKELLGTPTLTQKAATIGAGNQPVTEWQYQRGDWTYCVDFDYIGAGGAPLVFRTERYRPEFDWPS